MGVNRRRLLQSAGVALASSIAGCIGGKRNQIPDGSRVPTDDPESLLISLNELPEPEEGRGQWVVTYEPKVSDSGYYPYVEARTTYDIPWPENVANGWRYLTITIRLFEDADGAETHFEEEMDIFKTDPKMKTNGKPIGDQALYSVPKTDADGTHLYYQENNAYVSVVESEGYSGAKSVVLETGKTQLDKLKSATT